MFLPFLARWVKSPPRNSKHHIFAKTIRDAYIMMVHGFGESKHEQTNTTTMSSTSQAEDEKLLLI